MLLVRSKRSIAEAIDMISARFVKKSMATILEFGNTKGETIRLCTINKDLKRIA